MTKELLQQALILDKLTSKVEPAQPVSEHFPFYELKFIMRVLSHKGAAPREDWETAYGMALAVFNDWHKIAKLHDHPTAKVEPTAQPALPFCVAYGVKSKYGFDPANGHKQLIGLSINRPGTVFDDQIVELFTADQMHAHAARSAQPESKA